MGCRKNKICGVGDIYLEKALVLTWALMLHVTCLHHWLNTYRFDHSALNLAVEFSDENVFGMIGAMDNVYT
jgi:hypothetical protein